MVASALVDVSGDQAAAIAAGSSGVSGDNSAAVATVGSNVSGLQAIAAGGANATASGAYSATLGGDSLIASAAHAVSVGGTGNAAQGSRATVVGGTGNDASGSNAHVAGSVSCNAVGVAAGAIASVSAYLAGGEAFSAASDEAVIEGDRSAIIASGNGLSKILVGASSANDDLIAASTFAEISESFRSVILASNGGKVTSSEQGLLAAVETGEVTGTRAALLGGKNCRLATSYAVAGGYSTSGLTGTGDENLTWRLESQTGTLYLDDTTIGTPADYAEAFELLAGEGPLGPGELVALEGDRVRRAVEGDVVLGVTSANPSHIGNAAAMNWRGRWERDEWGRVVTRKIAYVRWGELRGQWASWPKVARGRAYSGPVSELGKHKIPARATVEDRVFRSAWEGLEADAVGPIPEDAERWTVEERVPSAQHDPSLPYVPRTERPEEWAIVGLLGQIRVRVAEGVAPCDWIVPGDAPGVGVSAPPSFGRLVRAMAITSPFDADRGFAIALCMVG